MNDCTTAFKTLKGFLPMNLLEKAVDKTSTVHGAGKFTAIMQPNWFSLNFFTQH